MEKIHKGYKISTEVNEWGFFEATSIYDCDRPMIFNKTLEGIKEDIDDKI